MALLTTLIALPGMSVQPNSAVKVLPKFARIYGDDGGVAVVPLVRHDAVAGAVPVLSRDGHQSIGGAVA